MITALQPVSPALAALYKAIGHRERFESWLGASEGVQMAGIDIYRRNKSKAADEAVFVPGPVAANVAAGEKREREGQR